MVIAYRFEDETSAYSAMVELNAVYGFIAILSGEILIVTSYVQDEVPNIEAICRKHQGALDKVIRSRA